MSRYARRRDANHTTIARALTVAGVWVWHTEGVGQGFPDLLVWTRASGFVLLEVKNPENAHGRGRKNGARSNATTARQVAFRAVCPGPVHVVTSIEEAFDALGFLRVA